MNEENILALAQALTSGDRQEAYGSPIDNYSTLAGVWSHLIAANALARDEGHITAEFAQVLMLAVKLVRLAKDPTHFDSLVDTAGYARTIQMTIDEREKHNAQGTLDLTSADSIHSRAGNKSNAQ